MGLLGSLPNTLGQPYEYFITERVPETTFSRTRHQKATNNTPRDACSSPKRTPPLAQTKKTTQKNAQGGQNSKKRLLASRLVHALPQRMVCASVPLEAGRSLRRRGLPKGLKGRGCHQTAPFFKFLGLVFFVCFFGSLGEPPPLGIPKSLVPAC